MKESADLSASYDELNLNNVAKTHTLVEHPVPIKPTVDRDAPQPMRLMLTKKELKRDRKLRKAKRLQEKQDMIRANLLPAEKPKTRLANMMRVLLDEAVADPTEIEARVRAEREEREMNHKMRNMARMLTPAERKQRAKEKDLKGTDEGVSVALFYVRDISDGQHRFKVDVNATENHLTGTVLECPTACINLVVVEGGARPVKRYIRLMTKRIDWNSSGTKDHGSDSDSDDDVGADDQSASKNRCLLVWQGVVPHRTFSRFGFETCSSIHAARRAMQSKGLVHYWDQMVAAAADSASSGAGAGAGGARDDGGVMGVGLDLDDVADLLVVDD